jgi:hypothetical protein
MPSNKVIAIFIICAAGIGSFLLLRRQPVTTASPLAASTVDATVQPYSYRNISTSTDYSWKSILTKVDSKNQTFTDLTKGNSKVSEETGLTAQLSQEFLAQYLAAKKGGQPLTQASIDSITKNVLSDPKYSKVQGPTYIGLNLHTVATSDASLNKYKAAINLILKNRSLQIKEDPALLFDKAMKTDNSDILARIDPILSVGKKAIADLLSMEVPTDATRTHLGLLNASSNIVADLEAMRQINTDPVKSYIGLSQYSRDMVTFQNSLYDLNVYLSKIKS